MVGSGDKGNVINPFDGTSSSHVDGEDLIYADDIVGNNDVEDFDMESYQMFQYSPSSPLGTPPFLLTRWAG